MAHDIDLVHFRERKPLAAQHFRRHQFLLRDGGDVAFRQGITDPSGPAAFENKQFLRLGFIYFAHIDSSITLTNWSISALLRFSVTAISTCPASSG